MAGRYGSGDGDFGSAGGYGGGYGGGGGGGAYGEDGRPAAPVTYVPKAIGVDEIFLDHIKTGLNFDNFDDIKVESSGKQVPPPIQRFQDIPFHPHVLKNIQRSGYTKPTPIQKHALPVIAAGRDLMGCAQTGSGKTAAFLLPIIHRILEEAAAGADLRHPRALIIAPTRELAVQIEREAMKFAHETPARPVCVYGGVSVRHHLQELGRGCAVLVGTPGRLGAFIRDGSVSVENIRFIVLDEADRMLDQGFEPEIRRIMNATGMPRKEQRQTLMFSATFPKEIQQLAREFLRPDLIFKAVGILGSASKDITQTILQVHRAEKKNELLRLLKEDLGKAQDPATGKWVKKTLVFVERKMTADFVATYLSQYELPATSIHGDREQKQREEALQEFKMGIRPILIATSVAARGLDISGVDHVINFDMPAEIDDYVHRVGRTGRVGNPGRATAFFDPEADSGIVRDLAKILVDAQQTIPDWLAAEAGLGIRRPFQQRGGGGGAQASTSAGFGLSAATNDDDWD